jgi:hypothetical protein
MKKKEHLTYLVVIVAALIFLAIELSSAVTITSYTSMTGEGIVDRTIDIQTAKWYEGSKFTGTLRTPSMGRYGESTIDFTEEICMKGANETEIAVEGTYKNEAVLHRVDIRSYEVGSRYKFENTGKEYTKHALLANGNESTMHIEGGVSSQGRWSVIARDPGTRLKEFRDKVDYEGIFDIIIDYSIERATRSAPVSDWFGCP